MSEGQPLRIGIFVIAYNAVRHLARTIDRIPPALSERVEEIFVIDDASTDDTFYAALGYKAERGLEKLKVFRNLENQGYGGNQKVGYRYAIERGFDVVAMLHGDGQYAPEVLPFLLEPFERGVADVVFGSRMSVPGRAREGGMPLYKYLGNKVLTFCQNALTGMNLSEFHSGYRIYRTEALRRISFESFTNDWHFDTQILLAMYERGMRIVERPIPTYYGDEICHVNGIPYAINCLYQSARFWRNRRRGVRSFPAAADVPRPFAEHELPPALRKPRRRPLPVVDAQP
ncbi:MAG: glycosyltransferase family 2 protein [Planctomycetota bacterium]|nr:MAG: glycosyltransferase family 2 protein [Planctomycetota bacterium]